MLKPLNHLDYSSFIPQPPSRGCVLKQEHLNYKYNLESQPPSRGCVLKQRLDEHMRKGVVAAAFARLCVETLICEFLLIIAFCSRLRAAVC